MNNATLLAGFASFCIMSVELDANAALVPHMLEAEAFYCEMQQAGADYDGVMLEEADQPDEDRFADYNYEPDYCEDCGHVRCTCGEEDDREQEKLEGIWHRRDMTEYSGGSNERHPGGGNHYWDEY